MREYIQKGYMRITDIMPILGDIRIAYIPKLYEIVDFMCFKISKLLLARGGPND
jgi:hypothetical protein